MVNNKYDRMLRPEDVGAIMPKLVEHEGVKRLNGAYAYLRPYAVRYLAALSKTLGGSPLEGRKNTFVAAIGHADAMAGVGTRQLRKVVDVLRGLGYEADVGGVRNDECRKDGKVKSATEALWNVVSKARNVENMAAEFDRTGDENIKKQLDAVRRVFSDADVSKTVAAMRSAKAAPKWLVVSADKSMVLSQSTGTSWTSCMTIPKDGEYGADDMACGHLVNQVAIGDLVAYVCRDVDGAPDVESPSARVMLRCYVNPALLGAGVSTGETIDGSVVYAVDKMYGPGVGNGTFDAIRSAVSRAVKRTNASFAPNGLYHNAGYRDSGLHGDAVWHEFTAGVRKLSSARTSVEVRELSAVVDKAVRAHDWSKAADAITNAGARAAERYAMDSPHRTLLVAAFAQDPPPKRAVAVAMYSDAPAATRFAASMLLDGREDYADLVVSYMLGAPRETLAALSRGAARLDPVSMVIGHESPDTGSEMLRRLAEWGGEKWESKDVGSALAGGSVRIPLGLFHPRNFSGGSLSPRGKVVAATSECREAVKAIGKAAPAVALLLKKYAGASI